MAIKGLQKKFVTSLLIAGLLPGIAALVATYLSSNTILKNSIGSNFQEIAAAVAKKVEMIVDHDITDAQSLALSPSLINALEEEKRSFSDEISNYLREWQDQKSQEAAFAEILLTDRQGILIASNLKSHHYEFAAEDWWKIGYQDGRGAIFVSNLYLDDRFQNYFYDIVVPVRKSGEDSVLGVLRVTIRRDKLLRAIMEVRIGRSGHAMLVSSEGTPLICPILPPKKHLINDPLMRQISQIHPGWAIAKDDAHGGQSSIVGFAPVQLRHTLSSTSLDQQAWYTFIRQPPEETYAPIYGLLTKVGLVGFGMAFTISFLGLFAGRIIVKPIRLLKEKAQSIGQAALSLPMRSEGSGRQVQLAKRIDIKTNDELEDLASAFNQMSEALEESIETIRKQETELVQKEKLASIGQLMAALTHDLKNPLGVIRSSAQVLSDHSGNDGVKQEMCQYILEEVDRLTYRINDFLRFTRPKPPEKKAVGVEQLIDRALREFRAQGEKNHGVRIQKEVYPSNLHIEVDPDQINDALLNLLINAGEAMAPDGTIRIRSAPADDGQLEICITDTGEGIASDHLEKIFEPFFTKKPYGVGLGLTNVRRLVKENGGKIAVQSQLGKGTSFILKFPSLNAATDISGSMNGLHTSDY